MDLEAGEVEIAYISAALRCSAGKSAWLTLSSLRGCGRTSVRLCESWSVWRDSHSLKKVRGHEIKSLGGKQRLPFRGRRSITCFCVRKEGKKTLVLSEFLTKLC